MTAAAATDLPLPEPGVARGVMHRLMGSAFATGLLEAPGQWLITDVWLRLSRLWAAAEVAGGDPDAFLAEVPLPAVAAPRRRRLARRLAGFEARRAAALEADAAWDAAFFGAGPPGAGSDSGGLAAIEAARLGRWHAFMIERWRFLPLMLRQSVPKVRFAIPAPEALEAVYGPLRETPWQPFQPPDPPPAVAESRRIATGAGTMYWLRFPTPATRIGGMAWARVHEPRGAGENVPTLVFGNGTFVEFDHMPHLTRDLALLVARGVRVIELEAPWHGRRRAPGRYGGEPFLAEAPLASLDLMTALVREFAVLTGWCRERGGGRVGVGGISMGALAARTLAIHAGRWPARLRPDMLALITFCDRLDQLPFDSVLAQRTGLDRAIADGGWTRERATRMCAFTEPADGVAVPPERIVAVIGRRDRVTPAPWGERALVAMGVPEANIIRRRGGHLSASMGLARTERPWQRIAALLAG